MRESDRITLPQDFSGFVSRRGSSELGKTLRRKGGITMKYEKPELIVLPSAVDAIQTMKSGQTLDSICNPGESGKTSCGYQSDE